MDKNSRKEIFEALSAVPGLGLSVMVSFLIWIGIAYWVQSKFSLGDFVMIIGVLLGIGSGSMTFIKFCSRDSKKGEKNEK